MGSERGASPNGYSFWTLASRVASAARGVVRAIYVVSRIAEAALPGLPRISPRERIFAHDSDLTSLALVVNR